MSASTPARHRVFSYGTPRQPEVQRALYGREVPTVRDALLGYRVDGLHITDPEVRHVVTLASGVEAFVDVEAFVYVDGDEGGARP